MIPFLTTAFNFIPDIFLESFRWHADLSSDVEKLKELKAWMKSLEKGLLKISCSVYKSNNFQRAAVDALGKIVRKSSV